MCLIFLQLQTLSYILTLMGFSSVLYSFLLNWLANTKFWDHFSISYPDHNLGLRFITPAVNHTTPSHLKMQFLPSGSFQESSPNTTSLIKPKQTTLLGYSHTHSFNYSLSSPCAGCWGRSLQLTPSELSSYTTKIEIVPWSCTLGGRTTMGPSISEEHCPGVRVLVFSYVNQSEFSRY